MIKTSRRCSLCSLNEYAAAVSPNAIVADEKGRATGVIHVDKGRLKLIKGDDGILNRSVMVRRIIVFK